MPSVTHPRALLRSLFALCLVTACTLPVANRAVAQNGDEVPTVTHTYALENARVVQAPGDVIEHTTVIIRDGLITAIGSDAAIPFDAQRIAADSLTVYAGFITGLSHAGVETPDSDEEQQDVENPGQPPNDRAGIQPDRHARAMLDPSDNDVESLREIGFTTAHVVPTGDMLPGSGTIIQLTGDDANNMVLRGDASLFTQLEGASGVYPATSMAVIAKWRQLYHEAERRKQLDARYDENPQGMERPPDDPVHNAFFPVIDGMKPVFFRTEGVLEMYRALALQEDLGFPIALTGLGEGFRDIDALKQADAELFLTLNLPEKKDKPKQAKPDSTAAPGDSASMATPAQPGSAFMRDFRTRSYQDTDDEKKNLEARQALVREKYYENAAALHDAGLRFGFSTADTKASAIRSNLRTMIEHGLPANAALAALTTQPAEMLGLSRQLGTVEEGKIANLVVTNGPYFDEDTKVRYVFVDGQKFEIEEAAPAASGGEEGSANPAGTWNYTVSTPQGEYNGTIEITGDPGDLEGTISTEFSPEDSELEGLKLNGSTLTFDFDSGQAGRVSATVTIQGNEMEGTLEVENFGNAPITATRPPGPGW